MITITEWIDTATKRFTAAGIVTARLDALVLLADALGKDKSWLLAHGEDPIDEAMLANLQPKITARAERTPMAYIRGKQAFYGRIFDVTPDVLIPRPETETLLEMLRQYAPSHGHLLDVGTGSGAIAVTAALEFPNLIVDACDTSQPALAVAQQNATKLEARVRFFTSDLLSEATALYNVIVANLPYVDQSWGRSPETGAEPAQALFAGDGGLELIKKLLAQAPNALADHGLLLLEADPSQHEAIEKAARMHGFVQTAAEGFVLCFAYRAQSGTFAKR